MDEERRKYFEVLELSPEATLAEVRSAYLHLKDLYSRDSIVTSPIVDEFSEDSMRDIIDQIEVAYQRLVEYFEYEEHGGAQEAALPRSDEEEIRREIALVKEFSGSTMKGIREKMNVGLYDIALSSNIRMRYLEDIEEEKFSSLPPEVYLRGFVIEYAKFLSLDHVRVADDYMNRYHAWKRTAKG